MVRRIAIAQGEVSELNLEPASMTDSWHAMLEEISSQASDSLGGKPHAAATLSLGGLS